MITIHSFTFNPFQENTYLLTNENKEAFIIDPGMYGNAEASKLISFIEENGYTPLKIINTHAHIDHILGVDDLKTKFNIPFALHSHEKEVLESGPMSAAAYGLNFKIAPLIDEFLVEDQIIKFGESEIHCLLTPGHSPGSISFFLPIEKILIAGDTLFNGSIGRTDLPGGHHHTLLESIKSKLYSLPSETMVYPGHGPVTQIGYEKQSNPFVQG